MEIREFSKMTPPEQALFRAKLQLAGIVWVFVSHCAEQVPINLLLMVEREKSMFTVMLENSGYTPTQQVTIGAPQFWHPIVSQHNNRLYFN
jgi:hypothetical protein